MESAVEKVKKKLWQFGYSVKDVRDIPGLQYDLLVDQKHQVKVIEDAADKDSIAKLIAVAIVSGEEITYHVCADGVCREETSPLKAFPKVDTQD